MPRLRFHVNVRPHSTIARSFITRALTVATAVSIGAGAAALQGVSVLHIRVVLVEEGGEPLPVPRHALLVSDNPATATPRRVVTALDGTVDVRLRPGNYTVESDEPVAFHGKAYHWTQTLDVAAGRDAVLELTSNNAEIESVGAAAGPVEDDPWLRLPQWQDSVVALWTPIAHGSGVVVDANGLIATSQQVIGTATEAEVQLTPTLKVSGRVVVADAERDVAILRIDTSALASARPVPLECARSKAAVVDGQKIFTISVPLRQQKGITPGAVRSVGPRAIVSDLGLAPGGEGGPVFSASGDVLGITSIDVERKRGETPIVRVEAVCDVVAAAEKKLNDAAAPSDVHLPVEPVRPFPVDVLENAARTRAGSLNPYQISSSDFDIAFITPVMIYSAQHKSPSTPVRQLMEFSNWSDYVADIPPVLLVRATPKMVEGFWTRVARGAAQTQGVALPPIKHFKSGFSRMRAFCGDNEITPIHPFKLEHPIPGGDAIYEGLYVFDPDALGSASRYD
jgi:S1-C subfamily serine protease